MVSRLPDSTPHVSVPEMGTQAKLPSSPQSGISQSHVSSTQGVCLYSLRVPRYIPPLLFVTDRQTGKAIRFFLKVGSPAFHSPIREGASMISRLCLIIMLFWGECGLGPQC